MFSSNTNEMGTVEASTGKLSQLDPILVPVAQPQMATSFSRDDSSQNTSCCGAFYSPVHFPCHLSSITFHKRRVAFMAAPGFALQLCSFYAQLGLVKVSGTAINLSFAHCWNAQCGQVEITRLPLDVFVRCQTDFRVWMEAPAPLPIPCLQGHLGKSFHGVCLDTMFHCLPSRVHSIHLF